MHVDLTEARPSDEELLTMLLGRTGKLRAPAIKTGKKVVVGFNAELLEATLV